MLAEGIWCDSDLNPRLFYRRPLCAAGGGNEKTPCLFAFFLTRGRWPLLGAEAKERNIHQKPDTIRQVYGIWRRTRLAMPKTNLRAGLIVIEAWFGGY